MNPKDRIRALLALELIKPDTIPLVHTGAYNGI
jgi:hypothetical protein